MLRLKAKKKTKSKKWMCLKRENPEIFECPYTSIKLLNASKKDESQATNWEIFTTNDKRLIFLIHKEPL